MHLSHMRRRVLVYSSTNHQELFSTLKTLSEDDLETWAAGNREQLTLSFLGWVAEQEASASGPEQEFLWDLGSRLMALREGLTPIAAAQLTQELASASAAQQVQSTAVVPAPASGLLSEAMLRNAALGLSIEGMELLEQQAAALEATMGTRRAQALIEIIGRKRMCAPNEASHLFSSDAAGRILEVLVQVDSREERAAMLPEAFTPPDATAGASGSFTQGKEEAEEEEEEEEELFTTPLQLLQAVDLWLQRAEGSSESVVGVSLLPGASLGIDSGRFIEILEELREDILATWESSSGDDF